MGSPVAFDKKHAKKFRTSLTINDNKLHKLFNGKPPLKKMGSANDSDLRMSMENTLDWSNTMSPLNRQITSDLQRKSIQGTKELRMSDRKFRAFKNFLRRGSSRMSMDSFVANTSALENTHSSSDDLQQLEENEIYMQLS